MKTAQRNPAAPPALPVLAATDLQPQSAVSLYVQIKDILRAHIVEGRYPPHHRLPSENDMIAAFSVSRITIRQALNDLENEGLIFRIHGKGTFVAQARAFQDLGQLQGFGEAMRQQGHETFSKVISLRQVAATPQVRERLGLAARERVTELRRVRFLNRQPISLDVTYLAAAIGARLAREDLATRDVFAILENDYGLALGHADLQIGSMLADARLAGHLRLQPGAPVLFIERLTHALDDGRPVDYEHLYYRGDAFQYKVRVSRAAA